MKPADDCQLMVRVCGRDVQDATTGVRSSSSVDDIVAWFLETAPDRCAYFVRHAYVTGADDPNHKLRWWVR